MDTFMVAIAPADQATGEFFGVFRCYYRYRQGV
jgi:hypothetical protein